MEGARGRVISRRLWVNVAGVVCYRAGCRYRFFFNLHIWHGRRDEPTAFSRASTAT